MYINDTDSEDEHHTNDEEYNNEKEEEEEIIAQIDDVIEDRQIKIQAIDELNPNATPTTTLIRPRRVNAAISCLH